MSDIDVRSQLRQWRISVSGLRRLLAWQLKRLGCPAASLSVLLCGDRKSRDLNVRFRRTNRPTDILSFPASDKRVEAGSCEYIGDLALNLPYAYQKRGRFDSSFAGEVAFLVLHGLAHLLGYHHDTADQKRGMDRLMARAWPPPKRLLQSLRLVRVGSRA